ncbi:sensor histidine kinase [Streptomyces sp. NBC_00841]|uniref:sensor histidine kinase n=1 Tax=unclassified Streptomyces TaxID=2593676 RepID=UPI00224EC5C8|nr:MULTISPECIES: sensor histidine kinase [unclassified Streptomyces]MCX4531457.1 sensor histidine kinase [Streptomyces sp. NBC_01669]WSA02965.1 sensor histidine kinase [Streptomyces sp. NBC_00841]
MSVKPPVLKRVSPGAWTALAWCVSVAYPSVVLGARPDHPPVTSSDAGLLPQHRDWATITLATLVAFTAAALLRRRPLVATGLLIAATVAETEAWRSNVQLPPTALPAVAVALCLVTATCPRRTSRAAAAMVVGVLFGHLAMLSEMGGGLFLTGTTIGASDGGLLVVLIAWLVGRSMRQSREHAETLGAQTAAQAVTAERLRIAREMHDTVAHSIGIVALQAGAARRVIDSRPDRARDALTEIEAAGRETLAGLRRMLGALRQADQEAGAEVTALHHMSGLADLDRLTAATTAAGVRVDVRWHGERPPLLPEIDLAAFRIIQESVTNVLRHAGARSCQVSIDCRNADEVAIEITDRGRGHSSIPGSGYGLAGLRERVALLHGEFHAAPRADGGFQVSARLPVAGGA